jgi:AraC family transcriptional regulator
VREGGAPWRRPEGNVDSVGVSDIAAASEEEAMASCLQPPNSAPKDAPSPNLSSLSRQWNGVVVELYRVRDVDFVKEISDHTVTVFLRGPVDLLQRRNGRVFDRTMGAGDVILAPAGEPKALRHKEEAELVKVRLAPSFVAGILDGVAVRGAGRVELLDNFGTRDALIEDLTRRLVSELKSDAFGSRLYVDTLATELVVHLLRHYSTATKLTNGASSALPRYKLQRVTDYINDNLREELTLRKMSAMLSMSPYHFAHAFRQTTGLAPHRFVITRRIELAKHLLRETDLSITEIAHQVGYSNQSNFSVVFHRFAGQTPRQFRYGD